MRTLLLAASFSLSLAAVCSGVLPGIDLGGEGDLVSLAATRSGPETSIGSLVSCRASPPSIGRSQTWDEPPRLETKAIVLPSGLQRGWLLVPGAVVSRFGSPPAAGTSQRLLFVLSVARSSSETT